MPAAVHPHSPGESCAIGPVDEVDPVRMRSNVKRTGPLFAREARFSRDHGRSYAATWDDLMPAASASAFESRSWPCTEADADQAVETRQPRRVGHHSDRGSQYTSIAFGTRCQEAGVFRSMGQVGSCHENALCESFFATSKAEWPYRFRYRSRQEARLSVFAFSESRQPPAPALLVSRGSLLSTEAG